MSWRFEVYKLVAVGGKLRGMEIILEEGENIIGRSHSAQHVVNIEGVSKQHMRITVNGASCFLEDLGSSNGTYVNSKLVRKATVKDKDKVTLPNVIFQIVFVKEKKKIIKKKVVKTEEDDDVVDFTEDVPKDLLGRIKHTYKHKVMKVFYGFNEQYEWNVMLGIIMFLFVLVNIYVIIGPVLVTTKNIVYREIETRGKQYALEVVRANTRYLKNDDLTRIDTSFLDNLSNEGVQSYELFDMDGRIIRPSSKINTYITDVFSVKARDEFKKTGKYDQTFFNSDIYDGEVGIAKTLMITNQNGVRVPKGIIAIRFQPDSLRKMSTLDSTSYLEALVYTSIVAIFFFGFVYYLTLKPIEELRRQIEEVMRGKKKEIDSKLLFEEMKPLRSSINTILQKNRELLNEDVGDFAEHEEDGPYVQILNEILQGSHGAAMVLDSEKNIQYVNELAGDLTGMRESLVQGENILDAASNEGFAGALLKLCDDSANNGGTNQSDYYELEGDEYVVNVSSLMGKDGFAKAFYITYVKDK